VTARRPCVNAGERNELSHLASLGRPRSPVPRTICGAWSG